MTADWRKDHWRANETDSEHAERVAAAEEGAHWYFQNATQPQHQLWRDTLTVIEPYRGSPRWTRLRDDAHRRFKESTKAAHDLYEETAEMLLRDGEVSEAMSERWDALKAAPVLQAAE